MRTLTFTKSSGSFKILGQWKAIHLKSERLQPTTTAHTVGNKFQNLLGTVTTEISTIHQMNHGIGAIT